MATEKRLIEANGKYTINAVDLTGFILSFSDGIISVVDRFGHVACEFYTDDIPAVDAVEVVHGNWVYYSTSMQECSNCKRHTARHKFRYCPYCGAVMGDKLHYAID